MQTARFFVFNLLGYTLPMAIALVSVPVIAHYAGVERLGALGVVWALVGYFGFLGFGLSRVVTRRVAQAAEQGRLPDELADLRSFFWWFAAPTLVFIALLLIIARSLFSGYLPPGELGTELAAGWVWIACSISITLATNWMRGALEGVHRFARVNILRTVFGGWTFIAPAVAALYHPTLDAMIVGIVLGRILELVAHGWACLSAERGILIGPSPRSRANPKLYLQEGGWITIANVITPLMLYTDRFVMAALAPPRAVAWYVTSQEVLLRTTAIPVALVGVLFPKFSGNLDANSEVTLAAVYQRGIRVVAALMLPLCALAAAGAYDGLRLWLGEEFAINAHRVAEVFAVGIYVYSISLMPHAWLQAIGRAHLTAKVHLFEWPIYALCLYSAVSYWGIVGVAWMWVLRVIFDCLLLVRLVGQESAKPVAMPLIIGMVFVALACLFTGPDVAWQWRALSCALALSGGFVLAWTTLLHREDREEASGMRDRARKLLKI